MKNIFFFAIALFVAFCLLNIANAHENANSGGININLANVLSGACSGSSNNNGAVTKQNCDTLTCENTKSYCTANCGCVNQETCNCSPEQCNQKVNAIRAFGEFRTANAGKTSPFANIKLFATRSQNIAQDGPNFVIYFSFFWLDVALNENTTVVISDANGNQLLQFNLRNNAVSTGYTIGSYNPSASERQALYASGSWVASFVASDSNTFNSVLFKNEIVVSSSTSPQSTITGYSSDSNTVPQNCLDQCTHYSVNYCDNSIPLCEWTCTGCNCFIYATLECRHPVNQAYNSVDHCNDYLEDDLGLNQNDYITTATEQQDTSCSGFEEKYKIECTFEEIGCAVTKKK